MHGGIFRSLKTHLRLAKRILLDKTIYPLIKLDILIFLFFQAKI